MIRSISLSVIVVVLSGCAGTLSRAHPVLDTVRVAAPTGERSVDRASVQAAFDAVEAGGTVAFAAGTYVLGGDGLVLRTPGVAVIGHPASTTLLGCTREQRMSLAVGEYSEFSEACGDGLVLAAEAQRVSGLRFESFALAISIREATESEAQGRSASFTGGHVVEDNSFHDGISFEIVLDADSTVRVRRNVFRNVWHAVAIVGGNIQVTENDVSVPEPERVPHGFAGVAIGALADADGACSSMIVEDNLIDGHTEAIAIAVFPHRLPGSACSDITIRDNEIVMRPVRRPDGRLAIAPAIRLFNAQRLVSEGLIEWGEPPEGGWPDALSEGRISDVRVEGNRITGAVGIGIEAAHVTDTRIVDNEIEVRPAATPEELEGLTVGGNAAPGVWVLLGLVDEVNGTPVWVSPGSEGTAVRPPAGEPGSTHPPAAADTVHVAPPNGEKEEDRASILAALEAVRPGGTVQFARGTYLVGELIRVTTSDVTLRGHPDGTILRGCDPGDFVEVMVAGFACNGLELAGGRQNVRDLTFEYAWHGLFIGCCFPSDLAEMQSSDGPPHRHEQPGGHHIEGNTFRSSSNGMRIVGRSAEPIIIRGNRFINTFHALVINGGTAHFLDNDISTPDPAEVPIQGRNGGAIIVMPDPPVRECGENVIAGNRIVDYADAIRIYVADAGARCERNVVRGNSIVVRRNPLGNRRVAITMGSPSDTTVVGIPLAITNEVPAGGSSPGDAGVEDDAVVAGHLIEGNRIIGADGLGIEIRGSSGNRIVDNHLSGIAERTPFPGNTTHSMDPEAWRDANGSGIWISAGSDDNEIRGNTFEDIASHAVFIEGGSNHVEVRSEAEVVRDLGTGNRVTAPGTTSAGVGEAGSSSLDSLYARIDSIRRANGVPAAQVAVIRPDTTVIWNFGEGRPGTPVVDGTMFRAGSVSKTFAGLSMLMLVERGLVSLDDPLGELAPELPIRNPWRATHPVRLRHLLEAGAGFVGYQPSIERDPGPTRTDLRGVVADLPVRMDVQWRPGEYTAYHNLGPVITAYLVEKITGEAYADFVRRNLFDPLGMTHSSYFHSPVLESRLARPPANEETHDAAVETAVYEHIGGYWPSGGLSTSATELTALVRMLLDRGTFAGERLLAPETVERFETPTTTLAARELGVPLGHGINNWTSSFGGIVYHGHGGRTDGGSTGYRGYTAYYAYAPDQGTGFVFLGTEGPSAEHLHYPVMGAVLSHLHPTVRSSGDRATAEEVGDVTGCYVLANPEFLARSLSTFRVSVADGSVWIDEQWWLEPTGWAGVFQMRDEEGGPRRGRPDDALITFVTDEDGVLVLQHLDHRWESAVRIPAGCP